MKNIFINRKGSITIIAIYIFIIMTTSTTILLYFASLQSSLSKNQLESVQSRYNNENDLNKLIAYEENIDKYIKDKIFERYRVKKIHDDRKYDIDLEKDDELRKSIEEVSFRIRNIDDREIIYFDIKSKYNNIVSDTLAYGPCIKDIFELNKPFLKEEDLSGSEKDMFLDLIETLENENWDYEPRIMQNARKINVDKDLAVKFISQKDKHNILSPKKLIKNVGQANESYEQFDLDSMIVHLRRDTIENKSLTIGSLEDQGLITMTGVLYLEGDLIINQDFEFLGLIIMNKGKIIINSEKTPTFKGMLLSNPDVENIDSINLIHDKKAIYKSASFLPDFLDIDIKVVKSIK